MSEQPGKVDLSTPDFAAENRGALEALFPGIVADGVVDATRLGELLDLPVTSPTDGRERFGLTWAGKQEAVRSLLTPSRGTLVPDLEKSVDFDTAQNVFIEGDNLEALKLLQKGYNDKIKLIYIDPPYNTGNDFVYNDDFSDGLHGYLEYTGQLDEEGNRTSASADTSGRRHSKWLSMMYPRLVLARNLLRQDGMLFVTIDDNEGAHLRLLLDEIFGSDNFLANVAWKHAQQSRNNETYFSRHWNSLLVYRRSSALGRLQLPRTEEHNQAYRNPDSDPRGSWRSGDVRNPAPRPNLRFQIVTPSGRVIDPPANGWRWSKETIDKRIASGEIVFSDDETRIIRKIYLAEQEGRTPENLWDGKDVGVTRDANREIQEVFGSAVFDTPKPTRLLRRVIQLATVDDPGALILDFFAGSGATAHAAALQNADDGGTRRVVSVNIPEPVASGSAASQAGFRTVSEVTHGRLRWVIENVEGARALGLRTYSLQSSNFRRAAMAEESQLFNLDEKTLKAESFHPDAVAAELLLSEGVSLDEEWTRADAAGCPAVSANGVTVVPSLKLGDEAVEAALGSNPRVLVFLEDGFAGKDQVKANAFTQARKLGITMKTV